MGVKSLVFRLNKKCLELSHNKWWPACPTISGAFYAQQSVSAGEQAQTSNDSAEVLQKDVVAAKPKVCVRNINKKLKLKVKKLRSLNLKFLHCLKKTTDLAAGQSASEKNQVALSQLNTKQVNVIMENNSQLLKLEMYIWSCWKKNRGFDTWGRNRPLACKQKYFD